MDKLQAIAKKALHEIEAAQNVAGLDQIRVQYLGKKGELTEYLKSLGNLPVEQRPLMGQAVNQIKTELSSAIELRHSVLVAEAMAAKLMAEKLDVTLPARGMELGSVHPLTRTMQRLQDCFIRLGFIVADGPEIESDYYNFEALNIPAHHPARAAHDTFYFDENTVLRTHTSGVQIRAMEKSKPPIRVIAPGRVYRCDSDVTHTPMFHQIEGLWVDEGITFAHLKGVLHAFLTDFFETEVTLRLRPSFFPFTEPSAEVDVACVKCQGKGCRICKHSGWLEVLGCGMVHPNVLKACGIDSNQYTGFAFGAGLERLTMLRYAIDDLRTFYENDVRFLQQF